MITYTAPNGDVLEVRTLTDATPTHLEGVGECLHYVFTAYHVAPGRDVPRTPKPRMEGPMDSFMFGRVMQGHENYRADELGWTKTVHADL